METAVQEPVLVQGGSPWPINDELAYLQTGLANVYFHGPENAGDRGWTLIDAGIFGFTSKIREAAEQRFGAGARPQAIILTHGHFDHVGAVRDLADTWDAPVYAHELEMPYLTGRSPYPPGDSTVGGGALAATAWLYPRGPIDLTLHIRTLPEDGSVPGMTGWRWIHTPGHTPGHISLFHDQDRTLIAGDAVITVKQESALAVLQQTLVVHGPPAYFTPDWEQARQSVMSLAQLEPELLATGHGVPLKGQVTRTALHNLAANFQEQAVPKRGRYVGKPAITNQSGIVAYPPSQIKSPNVLVLAIWGVALMILWIALRSSGRNSR